MTGSASDGDLRGVLGDWYAIRALVALEWLPAILVSLMNGPKHYSELLEDANALHLAAVWDNRHGQLHESTLTRALKHLTEDGLIERQENHEAFITRVRYTLTPSAERLLDAVVPLTNWARQHDKLIEEARRRRQLT